MVSWCRRLLPDVGPPCRALLEPLRLGIHLKKLAPELAKPCGNCLQWFSMGAFFYQGEPGK